MMCLLRGELIALLTTRLVAPAAGVLALVVGAASFATDSMTAAYAACFAAMALGAVATAWEWRDDTLGLALLAAPSRWPVAAAKVATYSALGTVLGLLALGVAVLATQDGTTWPAAAGAVAAAACGGALGVAAGLLVGDPPLAVLAGTDVLAIVAVATAAAHVFAALLLVGLVALSVAAAVALLLRWDLA